MIIRIKKCNNPKFWYYNQEGKVFEGVTFDKQYNEYYIEDVGYIDADDCEMIDFENKAYVLGPQMLDILKNILNKYYDDREVDIFIIKEIEDIIKQTRKE